MPQRLDALARTQPQLARILTAGWERPAAEWSRGQWATDGPGAFEPAFRRALVAVLRAGGHAAPEALVAGVEAGGAVLTPHHVCPTPGPTFGAIDRLACAGHAGPVLVLAWSGVPMSNSAASGALCFATASPDALVTGDELKRQRKAARDRARDGVVEGRVTLIPGALRDGLVYRCPIPDRTAAVWGAATPALQALAPLPEVGADYADWSLGLARALQRGLTGRADLHYVDLNQVAARYLVEVLGDRAHPLSRWVAMSEEDTTVPGLSWGYTRRLGKRQKVVSMASPPSDLGERIASGEICPGLVPVFGALRVLSRIRLLGGYRQVTYLETIATAWQRATGIDVDPGWSGRLMTGRLSVDGAPAYPLDVALGTTDRDALPGSEDPMSRFWSPILDRILANA